MISNLRWLCQLCFFIVLGLPSVAFAQPDLLEIAENQTAAEISAAIKAGANLQTRNDQGDTALILAAKNNDDPAAVKTLLDAGADVSARNIEGVTALMAAVEYGYQSAPIDDAALHNPHDVVSALLAGRSLQRERFSVSLERPIAVMLDNAQGYPQAGLSEASMIAEMPIEAGLTRLMAVYDRNYPVSVGPVRGTRDYFHTLVENMQGILVHDGGSPAALQAIEQSSLPTFNAFTIDDFFTRRSGRDDPYNLYSSGAELRDAINRLRLQRPRLVSGTVYRPEPDAAIAANINIRYSDVYSSGFSYRPETDQYRWVRNGQLASDATGEAVLVDAVVIANITAQPIPGDDAGQLYIPLSGDDATLFVNGRVVPGRWTTSGGFQFLTAGGESIDLHTFRHWVAFIPQNVDVEIDPGPEVVSLEAETNDIDEVPASPRLDKNLAVVQALLAAGADVNAGDAEGKTALMRAAELTNNVAIVRELLAAGSRVDARDREGRTALMWAATNSQNPTVLELLLDAEADPSSRDRSGRTAFDYAEQNTALQGTDVYWRLNDARFD